MPRISATDPVYATTIDIEGIARIPSVLSGVDMWVRSGAVARPATDEPLRLDLSGTLRVESGGRVDIAGYGYLGGRAGHVDGEAPDGIAGSTSDAGGSHGGIGIPWNGGIGGEVYGSVYLPGLPGGGGSRDEDNNGDGTRGGGVLRLTAGVLELEGEIRVGAQASSFNSSRPAGAGGSFLGSVGIVRGGGLIDVSGSNTGTNFTVGAFRGSGWWRSGGALCRHFRRFRSVYPDSGPRRSSRYRQLLGRCGYGSDSAACGPLRSIDHRQR